MVVYSGGAALSRPCGKWAASYDQMLSYLPHGGVDYLIPIICGNDWYHFRRVQPLGRDVMGAAKALCERMREVSRWQFAVVGGSADVWGYRSKGKMSAASLEQYDKNASALA